jgi:tRNA-specific 2-thiouridylase
MYKFNIDKPISKIRVVVAMSGGVDSSTVAAMLKDQGYDVIGVTLQLYDLGVTLEKKGACCAGQDIYDAKNVSDMIGIPHYVLNYETIFKQSVMDDFADSYLRGETPIPCVRCNQSVKFRDLFKVAKDLGADALATGHYAIIKHTDEGSSLYKGLDHTKDQSYFLFATTPEQLDYLHFPLGELSKEQTREMARKYNLPVMDKPDSQDICFVPNGSYVSVISKMRPGALDKGEIVHIDGRVLGEHKGIIGYTIGQRRGLGISNADPLYVVGIDAENKRVIVGPEDALYSKAFVIKEVNWLDKTRITGQFNVRLRSMHKGSMAKVTITGDKGVVELSQPEKAITPGQACVIYDGDRVVGGGWVTKEIS